MTNPAPATRPRKLAQEGISRILSKRAEKRAAVTTLGPPSGLRARLQRNKVTKDPINKTPFERMQDCRNALAVLDRRGWKRSFHQRLFHEDFLKACTRIFWKREPPGTFARDHQRVLMQNGWDHLAQEVLISTPRRFGKTISVSMFAAAMLYAAPNVEISIYSTCKRISQKLLRNVSKFFMEICGGEHADHGFSIVRQNMEEIVLQGTLGVQDHRIVNSYPSKVITKKIKSLLAFFCVVVCCDRIYHFSPHCNATWSNSF